MNDNDGGPAFPVTNEDHHAWGISMRDYFAAKAMQAFAADAKRGPDTLYMNYESASKEAYAIADAMLAARSA